jgi:hypothetical protein
MPEDDVFDRTEDETRADGPREPEHLGHAYFDDSKRDALVRAMREKFGMTDDDAVEIAGVIADQFGDQPEVNDETLEPTVRSIFYTLEAKKILSFRREEYTWENGEKRRGFWWRVREEALAREVPLAPAASDEDVYAALPKSVWTARQNA